MKPHKPIARKPIPAPAYPPDLETAKANVAAGIGHVWDAACEAERTRIAGLLATWTAASTMAEVIAWIRNGAKAEDLP